MIEKVRKDILKALHEGYPIPFVKTDKEHWLAWYLLETYEDYIYSRNEDPTSKVIKEIQEFTKRDFAESTLSFFSSINWNKIKNQNELNRRIGKMDDNSQLILEPNRGNLSFREAQALFFNYFYDGDFKKIQKVFGYKNVSSVKNLLDRAERKVANGLKTMRIFFINETLPERCTFLWTYLLQTLGNLTEAPQKYLTPNITKALQEVSEAMLKIPNVFYYLEEYDFTDVFGEEIDTRMYKHLPVGKNCPIYQRCSSISVNFLEKYRSTGNLESELKKYSRWIKINCPREKDKSIVCSTEVPEKINNRKSS